jgi:hypothetical protein
MIRKKSLKCLGLAALIGAAACAQDKPNLSGAWELISVERDGRTFPLGSSFKETFVWNHQEPKLAIKMLMWHESRFSTLEFSYTTDGKFGLVGYRPKPDGTREPAVNGSAHWEGNQLVYEQIHIHPNEGSPRRIIRTCNLVDNGTRIVTHEVYWLQGSDERHEGSWTWKKKTDAP